MDDFVVEPASGIDFESVPRLELAAAKMLDPADLVPAIAAITTSTEEAMAAQQEGRLIVARTSEGKVIGFALLAELDGHTHLEELDVAPQYGRQGTGRALVCAAIEAARVRGDAEITLSTFAHVPWNAPFYTSMGFGEIPPGEYTQGMQVLRRSESELGLDLGKRIVMSLRIDPARA